MNTRFNRVGLPTLFARLMLAIAVLSGAGCTQSDSTPASAASQALPVSVMETKIEPVPLALEAVGQAEGAKEVEVRARVGGILMQRLYSEGASVKAGQALFQIDKAPYEIALAQAKGQLAEATARAEQARREAARLKGLLQQRAISRKEYDDATSNNAAAEAAGQIAEAAVREAKLNLSYTTVTAPVGGVAGRAELSEGTLVTTGAGSLLTNIVQTDPLWVRFGVAQSELAALRNAAGKRQKISKVLAVLPDGSVYGRPGRLNFESAEVDRQLGTIALRAEFANPDHILIPGQFVRVRVLAGERQAILVPQTAALEGDRGTMVFVVDGEGKAQPRPIKTDGWQGANWVVTSGLKEGEKVILDNLLKLRPGAPVKAVAPEVKASAATGKP